jgi:kynureninase
MSYVDSLPRPDFSAERGARDEFLVPLTAEGSDVAYFAGNSLGLQPRAVGTILQTELDDWASMAVEGHFEAQTPWASYHHDAARLAGQLVGSSADESVMMNGLTTNLHLLMASFFRPASKRRKILMEGGAFPSDRYAVESHLRWHGMDPAAALLLVYPDPVTGLVEEADVEALLDRHQDEVALVLLGGVQFRTGQRLDIPRLTRAGQAAGAMVGWDLAHAAGNVPLQLHDWGVDFAAWCSYKYLNCGPGATAGAFVHERHHHWTGARLEGWWGVRDDVRFRMDDTFVPAAGAHAWQLSNVPVLSTAPWLVSGHLFASIGSKALWERTCHLTSVLLSGLDSLGGSVKILTPRESERRGSQISIAVERDARELARELRARGVVCDARPPSILRFAPTAMYNTETDIQCAIEALAAVLHCARS